MRPLLLSLLTLTIFLGSFARVSLAQTSAVETPVVAQPMPEQLLAKMSAAIKSANYSGEFTYEFGNQLESYRVVHQVVDGEEFELLQRLSGKDTRLTRKGDLSCGTIGRHLLAGARLSSSGGAHYGVDRFYHSSIVGRDRIAGREAWVLQLLPRDEHRFGLVLAVDSETSLLLKHVVFDARKKVALERMQFVSLDVGQVKFDSAGALPVSRERCITDTTYSPAGHSPWKPSWLPPGFILTGYEHSADDGHMETYTDGVSSFSVFVKQGVGSSLEEGRIHQGVSSRGASMALIISRVFDGDAQHISVIGEIPLSAAQKVSLSVRQSQENASGS